MSDELRDRIAEAFKRGADGYGGVKGGAQAIIDDLGLHVIETTGCVIGKLERP